MNYAKLSPNLPVAAIFPPLEDELTEFTRLFKGRVLNAGAGHRDISSLIDGELFNQDIPHGLHNKNIHIYSPLHEIPKPDNFFDAIICNAVLEHVANPEEILEEFARVCRPGGTLYLGVPFLQPEHKDPTDYQRYTADGLRLLAERHGFIVEKVEAVHNVYTTFAWMVIQWLESRSSLRNTLLKWLLYPALGYLSRNGKEQVFSLASCYRLLAKRGPSAERRAPANEARSRSFLAYTASADEFVANLPGHYHAGESAATGLGAMTTPNELAFLHRYARDLYAGKGKIVDLGCWFGATTAALAQGLHGTRHAGAPAAIEAFDLFEWADWMGVFAGRAGVPAGLKSGDCFFDHVKKSLTGYGSLIELHKADLMQYRPPDDWQIEFLFIDAMKTWDLAARIAKSFFPQLLPGQSLVVQQDFAFYAPITATNHLIMWDLRDYFEPLHHVPNSCSMVFRTKRTPHSEDIPDYHPGYFTESKVERAYDYCVPLVGEAMRVHLLVAKLGHAIICRQANAAASALKQLGRVKGLRSDMLQSVEQSIVRSSRNADPAWLAQLENIKASASVLAAI